MSNTQKLNQIISEKSIKYRVEQIAEEISNALFKVLSTKNEINNRKSVLHLDENIITSKLIEIYHKAINENLRNTKTNNGNNGV